MEISQENSLCSSLSQTKMSSFSFSLFSFFSYKIGEQEGGTSPGAGGLALMGTGEVFGKG
jgi:hypothetical protein